MSEDAKNSIFAWISVILFLASAALTVKLLRDEAQSVWSPVYSGIVSFAALYYLARHFARQRAKQRDRG